MKKILLILLPLYMFLGCQGPSTASAPEALEQKPAKVLSKRPFKERLLVAILEVANHSNYYELDKNKVLSSTVDSLLKTKHFRVVERSKMELLFKEMKLSESGLLTENIQEIGGMLGVDAILIVNIMDVKHSVRQSVYLENVYKVNTLMNGRLISVQSGEVLASAQTKDSVVYEDSMLLHMAQMSERHSKDTLMQDAIDSGLDKLIQKLAEETPLKSEITI